MTTRNSDSRCKAQTKKGKPCQAAATAGGLCFFHGNPHKASEPGRIGGRKNRSTAIEASDPLPRVESAIALKDALAQLIADLCAGKLQPKIAGALAPLLSLQFRAIETTAIRDLEQRIGELEKLVAETRNDRLAVHPSRTESLGSEL